MAQSSLDKVRQSPIDFCYIFVTSDYLSRIAKVFGQKYALNIESKYKNAIRYINGWGKENGMKYDAAKEEVRKMIVDQYGMSPEAIMISWANGKNVPGKDFKGGVYGIGETTGQTTFAQDSSAKVDPTTGTISFGSNTPEALWKTIDTNGKTIEMNYTLGGKTFTSRYNPSTGTFIANTYGDANGMQYANGTAYSASKASTTWENINTALPMIENFMEWLASLVEDIVGKFKPITRQNTVPAQSDYYVESTGTSIAGFGIVAALLAGGLLLGKKRRNKKG